MMSDLGSPAHDFDPYFVPVGRGPKGGAKRVSPGEADIRRDLLPTEAAFRVAGAAGMILGASIFVIFGLAVSSMLREGGEPGGILRTEDWLWRRWVARMATVFALSVVGVATCWGLRRLRPWARWPLVVLGAIPPLALLAGLGLRAQDAEPSLHELGEAMTMPWVAVFLYPSGAAVLWAACSRRGRAVLGPDHDGLVARTPGLRPESKVAIPVGLGLAFAILVLYWTCLFLILGSLVACGIIRTI